MAEIPEEVDLNIFDALSELNKESKTLNEFVDAFKQQIDNLSINSNTQEESIVANLVPKNNDLNLDNFDQTPLASDETSKTDRPFLIGEQNSNAKNETIQTLPKQNDISEQKIIDKITANLEKKISDLTKQDNKETDTNLKPSQKDKPVANKVNDFFKSISQQVNNEPQKDTIVTPSKEQAAPKKTESIVQSLAPETKKNEIFETLLNDTDVQNQTTPVQKNIELTQSNVNEPLNKNNLIQQNTSAQQPFFNFTAKAFEPALEDYFVKLQENQKTVTPENVKLNDIKTVQENLTQPQTVLNQNISEYNNQTLYNTVNPNTLEPIEIDSQPQTQTSKNETLFYTFQPESNKQNASRDFNIETQTPKTENIKPQFEASSIENFANDIPTENTETVFNEPDPVIDEILQNTKLTNQALQGIIKLLPAMLATTNKQTPQAVPQVSMPSFGGGNSGGNIDTAQNAPTESVPQIPGIRKQFLMSV
jgi:hypothetical protein